ncbi:MAG TPA: carboxy-S-adenosyl-L-methionine synthase CmoA [Woeseiaceae bacterium]|nr:carboxy-S-adenosyl-L-methionine synthase CmoA [Woeseiaceae bacterium]
MSKDEIYASDDADPRPFEFNENVARVFPDMLRRSIPGYDASIEAIGWLASRYVRANTRCYDLGCSLGAAAGAIRDNVAQPGVQIVAVDNAPAMVERCRQRLAADVAEDNARPKIEIVAGDAREIGIENASMVVMNYTLQFLPPEARDPMMRTIAGGLNRGGVFFLSEKVVHEDEAVERLIVDLHHEYKRSNAYSDLEISRKRAALENVLIPERVETHRRRLAEAGFRHAGVLLQYFNFVSMVAIR